MSAAERRFVRAAIRRRRLFLALSIAGVVIAVALTVFYTARAWRDPDFALGVRVALVVLILLNARQNLRQYRFAAVLEKLRRADDGAEAP